jgi:hypothetical protein
MSIYYKPDPTVEVPPFNPFAGVDFNDPLDWIYVVMTVLHPFVIVPMFIAGIIPGILWVVIREGMAPSATVAYKENRRRSKVQRDGGKFGTEMVSDYRYEDVLRERLSGVRRPIDNYYH